MKKNLFLLVILLTTHLWVCSLWADDHSNKELMEIQDENFLQLLSEIDRDETITREWILEFKEKLSKIKIDFIKNLNEKKEGHEKEKIQLLRKIALLNMSLSKTYIFLDDLDFALKLTQEAADKFIESQFILNNLNGIEEFNSFENEDDYEDDYENNYENEDEFEDERDIDRPYDLDLLRAKVMSQLLLMDLNKIDLVLSKEEEMYNIYLYLPQEQKDEIKEVYCTYLHGLSDFYVNINVSKWPSATPLAAWANYVYFLRQNYGENTPKQIYYLSLLAEHELRIQHPGNGVKRRFYADQLDRILKILNSENNQKD